MQSPPACIYTTRKSDPRRTWGQAGARPARPFNEPRAVNSRATRVPVISAAADARRRRPDILARLAFTTIARRRRPNLRKIRVGTGRRGAVVNFSGGNGREISRAPDHRVAGCSRRAELTGLERTESSYGIVALL